jgi:hypothetical protein
MHLCAETRKSVLEETAHPIAHPQAVFLVLKMKFGVKILVV